MTQARRLPPVLAGAFIVVWCSGYIAGPAAVHAAAPFTVLGWRFGLAALVALPLAWVLRRPTGMDRRALGRVALVGLVMNGITFSLMYVAFSLGLSATVGALLHALSPVLTAFLAGLMIGERVGWVQVVGFAVGVAGVLIVLGPDLGSVGGPVGLLLGILSVLGLSLGTLGQHWIGAAPDPLWSAGVQFAVSAPPVLVVGWLTEGLWPVTDAHEAIVSVLWLVLINSIAGLVLLAMLVVRGGSGAAASLFFLAPPVTAVMAYFVLGDTLGVRQLAGLAVAAIGVGAATRSRRVREAVVESLGE